VVNALKQRYYLLKIVKCAHSQLNYNNFVTQMKKRSIRLIIVLMSFALLGVMAMQFYFLRQSYLMQSELFDSSVNEALSNVVAKATEHDAIHFVSGKIPGAHYAHDKNGHLKIINKSANMPDGDQLPAVAEPVKKHSTYRERKIALLRDSLKRMILKKQIYEQFGSATPVIKIEESTDDMGILHVRWIPEMVKRNNLKGNKNLHKYDTLRYEYADPQFGNQEIVVKRIDPLWQQEQERLQNERNFRAIKQVLANDSLQNLKSGKPTVIQNLAEEYQKFNEPLRTRLDPLWIDSLLRFELHDKGIYLPFSYEVTNANNDSLIFSNATFGDDRKPEFVPERTYQTHIFGTDVINDPGSLKITFPKKNSLILGRMTATMATTGGLLFVLVFCFGYTIFSIIRQKKVSEMKTDFINNMTHEFKTPVSTIMIASEALKDDEIVADRARVARLAHVIYEENARLGSHIERVLNVARIERNDFKLEKKPLDVNEMINIVIDSMALKLQKHNAVLTLQLDAKNAIVLADELHFSNLIYNLIDNAIKYSPAEPEISISTANRGYQIVINVADKGIGMSRDQQTKIFEQFYRIPTGNLHDVKGFGLGLSYVNTIVKRLNGVISVRSEKDKGSDFELKFPLA
jgi:two-component system phosphate regulon sensor histidine kinase PhoR